MDGKRLALAALVAAMPSTASAQGIEDAALALVDTLSVSRLEPGLSKGTLVQWLERVTAAPAGLEVDDCGESAGREAHPICVTSVVDLRDGREVGVSVLVGDSEGGLSGEPRLWAVWLAIPRQLEVLADLRTLESRLRT